MASRLVRGTAIACGVAAIAGLGIGLAAGEPVDTKDIIPARKLPAELCGRLGDVSALLPKATNSAAGPKLVQTGSTSVRCTATANEQTQPTFAAAALTVTITPYAGKAAGAGQPPFTPAMVAKQAYGRKPWQVVKDRPYPSKIDWHADTGGQSWSVSVIVVRADVVVQVDYAAHPIAQAAAKQAALVMADRAIWESK